MTDLTKRQLYLIVTYLAIAFTLIFTGFTFAQSFLTAVFPGSFGFVVLLVLYAAFAVSALLAPTLNKFIIRKWLTPPGKTTTSQTTGETSWEAVFDKWAMIVSSIGYLFFLVTVSIKNEALILLGAVVCGCCASELWVSHGMWTSKLIHQFEHSQQSRSGNGKEEYGIVGRANGLFFTVLGINVVLSGVISIGILLYGIPFETLAWIMAVLCALGTLMMFFTYTPSITQQEHTETDNILPSASIWVEDWGVFREFMSNRNAWLIAPIMFLQGANNGYAFTNVSKLIKFKLQPSDENASLSNEAALMISYYSLVFGVGSIVGSYLWGKVYDIYRSRIRPLLLWHILLTVVTFSLLLWTILEPSFLTGVMMVISFLLAQLVYIQNSIIYNCSLQLFADKRYTLLMFSWYRFFFSVAFAIVSLLGSSFNSSNPSNSDWIVCYLFQLIASIVAIWCGLLIKQQQTIGKDETVIVTLATETTTKSNTI